MTWHANTLSDLRTAGRTLARRPFFTTVATLTLALGIAASTAMFTLVDGIVLRPLPYPHAQRLVEVMQSYPEKKLDRWTLSQMNVGSYLAVKSFASFAAHARTGLTFEHDGQADRVIAEVVTGDFFSLLGVRPQLGRFIGRDDDRPGNDNVVVLSYGFWQSRLGGSSDAIGKTLQLNGRAFRIVGLMPASFAFPKPDVQLYVALGFDPTRARPNFLTGIARLLDGVSPAQAEREATLAMWNWARRWPDVLSGTTPERTRMRVLITPLRTAIAGSVTRPLIVLQGAVMLILLIAIANVATLLTARGVARRRELAVRAALGASRRRIISELIAESLVLAALGGALGVFGGVGLVRTFTHSSLASLPRIDEVTVDWRVLLFACGLSGASGVLFGLIPALTLETQRLTAALSGQKSSANRDARLVNNALIAGQVALSFMLLVGAGLVLKSFQRLVSTDLGFDPERVMSMTMPLPSQRYAMDNQPRAYAFVDQVVARASALAGVRGAAVMFPAMYVNDVNSDGFIVEGQDTSPSTQAQTVQYSVSPGFFGTLRIPLLAGRDFTATDRVDTPPVVVVDQALVSRYWTPAAAVGKRVRMAGDSKWLTIVGVVRSIRDEGVAEAPRPHTYFPYAQYGGSRPTLVVRSDEAASSVERAARGAIAAVDPGVPVDNPHAIAAAISSSLATRRITELLLAGFGVIALLLAACGLYGVMSLYVANRRREFGIRAAMGAEPAMLVRVVLTESVTLVATGASVGFLASLIVGRSVRALLYEVTPTDVTVYVGVAGTLLVVAALACFLPARRAASSDPLIALRAD